MNYLSTYNRWLLAAAVLMLFTFFVHVFAGGADIYAPLRQADINIEVKSVMSVVWHMTSLLLFLSAGALYWLSQDYSPSLALFVGLGQLGFVLLFVGYGAYDTGTVTTLPQWTLFAACVFLMWVGHKRQA